MKLRVAVGFDKGKLTCQESKTCLKVSEMKKQMTPIELENSILCFCLNLSFEMKVGPFKLYLNWLDRKQLTFFLN